MGKIKRQRQKLHISPNNKPNISEPELLTDSTLPLDFSSSNIFRDINIDTLNTNLSDDSKSVKSYKSLKSEKGVNVLSKKEKLKLKHQVLLNRIDALNQMKKEVKLRKKRKNVAVIGDTNPLHDALPSLESLLKSKSKVECRVREPGKSKGIEKEKKRKKGHIQNVSTFKTILRNKNFKEDPFGAIGEYVKTLVAQEKSNVLPK